MLYVRNVMSTPAITIGMDDMLYKVREIFEETHFHHLPVVENNKLCGIVSDRDLLRALSPGLGTLSESERDTRTLKKRAHQIMSRYPVVLYPEQSLKEAISLFHEHGFSCFPVVNLAFKPVGMLSWRDVMRLFYESVSSQSEPESGAETAKKSNAISESLAPKRSDSPMWL